MRVMDKAKRKAPADWDGSFAPPAPDGVERRENSNPAGACIVFASKGRGF